MILVVDENTESLDSVEIALQTTAWTIQRARSGAEALQMANDCERLTAILIAASMPSMSGFECAELLRERPRFATTPIIFMTNAATEPLAFRGSEHGAVHYIVGPVEPLELRSKITALLGVRHEPLGREEWLAKLEANAEVFTHEVGNLLNNMYLQAQLLERQMVREPTDRTKHARLRLIMGEMQRLTTLLAEFQAPTQPKLERPLV